MAAWGAATSPPDFSESEGAALGEAAFALGQASSWVRRGGLRGVAGAEARCEGFEARGIGCGEKRGWA